jgi:uncharacterized damage-inducible protein DinB
MSDVKSNHSWRDELFIKIAGGNCDFNRFRYCNLPSTQVLKSGELPPLAGRDNFVFQLKALFDKQLGEGASKHTYLTIFQHSYVYLKWCDSQHHEAFTQASLEEYFQHLHLRVRRGEIKNRTYTNRRSVLSTLFHLLNLPRRWFDNIPILPKNDTESYEAYSQSDLKQLLPFLRALFKQTSTQFLDSPQKHIKASKNKPTMKFVWKGTTYQLCGAISKMMAAATYLLSYYTYSNTSVLLSLTRPKAFSTTTQEIWYSMPSFKRRAFKIVHVEMGEHTLDIPKYSMQFFDTLLTVSRAIDNSDNAPLLQTCIINKKYPVNSTLLQSFNKIWLFKYFKFTDQRGRDLRPVISRFRETGSQLTRYFQGDIAQNILLDNTQSVRDRHYSTGNRHENQGMIQDTALIRQQQAMDKSSAKEAQAALQIEVLMIDESQKSHIPQLSRTPSGGSCSNPFGEKSKSFNRKASQHQLSNGEKLACAELLSCFGCPSQVVVQSVSDIWCLLSFKECIEESLYLHLDASHYRKNFEKTIRFIDDNIIHRLKKEIVKQAENKLNEEGRHPLWLEAESVLPLDKNKAASL